VTDDRHRWQKTDALFKRALELDAASRKSLLDSSCANDPSLRKAVEDLLVAAEAADGMMEEDAPAALGQIWGDAFDAWQDGQDRPDESRIDEQLGAYRLTRVIGRGGNASVYLGERIEGEWEQQVAVKVMRRGIDTDDVVARFFAERQILSSLKHPNIAQLLDGGTTEDGLPYLVMEYVSGQTITGYCDAERMDIKRRLELFLRVAKAVQYAQQHLVVHRDLKPSNILVDEDGRVKLLDFGIAKLLESDALPGATPRTRTGYRPMTPRYASPEQIRGDTITTASDVYQLGLLLVELLTGESPLSEHPGSDRLIADNAEDALRPSTLVSKAARQDAKEKSYRRNCSVAALYRSLRGDLDTIALVATRADPARRYASATQLIADIERHLLKEPIAARRDSTAYRVGRFLRRQPLFLPAALLVLLAAGTYAWTLNRHATELENERNVARQEAERARLVKSLLIDIFQSPDPYQPASQTSGKDITVREALDLGMNRLRAGLSGQPAVAAELQGAVSDVLNSLDQAQDAYDLRADTLAIETNLYGEYSAEALESLRKLGDLALSLGRTDEAAELLERQLLMATDVFAADDEQVADSLASLGQLRQVIGPIDSAMAHRERAIEIYRLQTPVPKEKLAESLSALAVTVSYRGDTATAIPYQEEALALRRELAEADSLIVAETQEVLAQILSSARKYVMALPLFEETLAIKELKLGPDHHGTLSTRNNMAVTLIGLGRHEAAEQQLRTVLEIRLKKDGTWHQETAAAMQNLAATLAHQGKSNEASEHLGRAHEIYQQILTPDHYLIAYPLLTRAFLQLQLDDAVGAEQSAVEATRILRLALPQGHFATTMGECRWGQALARQGRHAEAESLLAQSVIDAENPQMPVEYRAECREALADLYEETGRVQTARDLRGN